MLDEFRRDGIHEAKGVLAHRADDLRASWRDLKRSVEQHQERRAGRFIMGDMPGALGDMHLDPALVSVAQSLLGPDVAVYFSRVLVKDAAWNGRVPPHQDMPYYHGGTEKLSVFVPIAPFNLATGGLQFAIGSHKFGFIGGVGDHEIEHKALRDLPTLAADVDTGDAIFADFLIWHWSEVANEVIERPCMQIVYQPASDGSWYPGQLKAPTLACGEWRTSFFLAYGEGITRR